MKGFIQCGLKAPWSWLRLKSRWGGGWKIFGPILNLTLVYQNLTLTNQILATYYGIPTTVLCNHYGTLPNTDTVLTPNYGYGTFTPTTVTLPTHTQWGLICKWSPFLPLVEPMRVWEMSIRRYSGLVFTSAAIILGGYGLMVLVTPTQDQLRAVSCFHSQSWFQRMSPEMRKKFDAQAEERMERKEKIFEHIKYNMNSKRPSTSWRKRCWW